MIDGITRSMPAIVKVLSTKAYGYDPNPAIMWFEHTGETPDGEVVTYYDYEELMPNGFVRMGFGQKEAPIVERFSDKPPIDRNAAFAAADDDYFRRCKSRNPHSSPWVVEVRAASGVLGMMDIRARCTLPAGHAGDHIGPDDVTWPQGQEEPDL